MKYQFMVRSRPEESIEDRHERLQECLRAFDGGWSMKPNKWPVAKDPGTLPMRQISLTRCFAKGIDAFVSYQNRKYVRDESKCDDYFKLEFDPRKVDYSALVSAHFVALVEAFRAYRGRLGNEEFIVRDADESIPFEAKRSGVYRVYPLNFWDKELCQRSFGNPPKIVAQRLKEAVERVTLVAKGVFVVATSDIVDAEAADELHRRIRPLLSPTSYRGG